MGGELSQDSIAIASNIASHAREEINSGTKSAPSWILYPWENDLFPGLVPYNGLLLGQLVYSLISPLSEKMGNLAARSRVFYSFSTTPGYQARYSFVTKKEQRLLGLYLKPESQVLPVPKNDFASTLANKLTELNRGTSWHEAYPILRQFIKNLK